METSLFFKTFVVFGSQLGLLFGACYYFIFEARKSVLAGEKFLGETFEAKYNKKNNFFRCLSFFKLKNSLFQKYSAIEL